MESKNFIHNSAQGALDAREYPPPNTHTEQNSCCGWGQARTPGASDCLSLPIQSHHLRFSSTPKAPLDYDVFPEDSAY